MKQPMIDYVKKEKFDSFYTPEYAVKPLLKYIKKRWVIWEPTDTNGKSAIAKALEKNGNKVISTSIKKFNFLKDEPDFNFDCIITNPPYTLKDEFIKKCYRHMKKWAMLMPLTALEGVNRGQWYKEHGVELLVLDRRVEFTGGSCWFNTSWFCHYILPEKLMFESLEKE